VLIVRLAQRLSWECLSGVVTRIEGDDVFVRWTNSDLGATAARARNIRPIAMK
jgi:hypothetical protein